MDHSCAPNAIIGFKGTEQIVYALSDILEVGPDKVFLIFFLQKYPFLFWILQSNFICLSYRLFVQELKN